jgi:hypothetical protein
MSQLEVTNHNMPRNEIPVDILRDILEYVDKVGLATMCRVNKICYESVVKRRIRLYNLKSTKA